MTHLFAGRVRKYRRIVIQAVGALDGGVVMVDSAKNVCNKDFTSLWEKMNRVAEYRSH